jgi:hypothetical protein
MRHDPASAALVIMLRSLKMYGMAQAVEDLAQQGAPAFEAAVPMLSQLLKAETAEREVRSMAYQLKAARFPAYRDLASFDFLSSEINEALVRQLHLCAFIETADNIVLAAVPAPAKPMSPRRLAFRRSNITKSAFASSRPWNWSTLWSKRRRKGVLDRSQGVSSTPISSSSMSLATCRSAPQGALCYSTCSASFTSAPVWSSPPTSASANGPASSAMPK